jgi:hypothetical protein
MARDSGPVKPDELAAVRGALKAERGLPETGTTRALLDTAASPCSTIRFNGHPRFLVYITSSLRWVLGDLAAHQLNSGSWACAHGDEDRSADRAWIAELLLDSVASAKAGGLLVSGGNMANFVCFLAARTAKVGSDVRKTGLGGAPRLVVYASSETHTWIQKAADLFGLGTDSIRWISVDGKQRMDTAELRRRSTSIVRAATAVRCRGGRVGLERGRSLQDRALPGHVLVSCRRRVWSAGRRRSRCAAGLRTR